MKFKLYDRHGYWFLDKDITFCCERLKSVVKLYPQKDKDPGLQFSGEVWFDAEDKEITFDTSGGEYGTDFTDVRYCPFCGEKFELEVIEVD